jgi:hypothetical protein
MGYGGMLLRDMAETDPSSDSISSRFVFAGFNVLAPAEVAFMDKLHEEGRLEVCWDIPEANLKNGLDPAGHFIRKWRKKPWPVLSPLAERIEKETQVEVVSSPSMVASVRWAGEELSRIHAETGSLEDTAVILADEAMIGPLLDALPAIVDKVNVTMGVPMKGHLVYHAVERFVQLHIEAERFQVATGSWKYEREGLLEWVEAWSALFNASLWSDLRAGWARENQAFIDPATIEMEGGQALLKELLGPRPARDVLGALASYFGTVEGLSGLRQGLVSRVADLLDTLLFRLEAYRHVEDWSTIWSFFRSMLQQERIPFLGEPHAGLQVMGLMESRALDFDRIIILGMNEGNIPKARNHRSFIGEDLRLFYKLPSPMEEEAGFAYYFYRLFGHSREMYLCHEQMDDLGAGEPSRYLLQLMQSPREYLPKLNVARKAIKIARPKVKPPSLSIPRNATVAEALCDYLTSRISFTGISKYNQCPLDFLQSTVFDIREEQGAISLENNDIGDIVHGVIEDLFLKMMGEDQKPFTLDEEALNWMKDAWPRYYSAFIDRKAMGDRASIGEGALAADIANQMLERFFITELARLKASTASHITGIETNARGGKLKVEHRLGEDTMTLGFKAKMDRIEEWQGRTWLLDYKTGRVDDKKLKLMDISEDDIFDPEKSKVLQLLYYAWFHWRQTREVAIPAIIAMGGSSMERVRLNMGKGRPFELSAEGLEVFERRLFDKLTEIWTKPCFDHDEETGRYCDLCPDRAAPAW